MATGDLFADLNTGEREAIGPCSFVLRGFALPSVDTLLQALARIEAASPYRRMHTPGGHTMSVEMSNCGEWGWTSGATGYRYQRHDPLSGQPWPALPPAFAQLARDAAAQAGFEGFLPDACLINRYLPGARMALHQDKNEHDLSAPIVSVSLGMNATFLFGGHQRHCKAARIALYHGDAVVWGGEDRLRFHGILPLKAYPHPQLGQQRINLTFRKAMA